MIRSGGTLAALVMLVACSSPTPQPRPTTKDESSIEYADDSLRIETANGTSFHAQLDHVADDRLPDDIPLPKGAEPIMTVRRTQPERTIARFQVPLAPSAISALYEAELDHLGWTLGSTSVGPSGGILLADKEERRLTVAISLRDGSSSTELVLTVTGVGTRE